MMVIFFAALQCSPHVLNFLLFFENWCLRRANTFLEKNQFLLLNYIDGWLSPIHLSENLSAAFTSEFSSVNSPSLAFTIKLEKCSFDVVVLK